MRKPLLPLSLLVLASSVACSSGPQTQAVLPLDGHIDGQCHTDSVRGARGLAASAQTLERARVDSDSLQIRRGAASSHSMSEAMPATGGDRLTVVVGRNNAIIDLYCG